MRAPAKVNLDSFRLENQMAASVVDWMNGQGLAVKREFSVPWGICDLVGVKLIARKVRRRLSYGQKQPIGPPLRLYILSKIPDVDSGRSITEGRLGRELFGYLPNKILGDELRRLSYLKFVTSPRQGHFQKRNGWAPLHKRIVAVELKLSRISEALAQASSNRTFTTESYVGLPSALAHRVAKSGRADEFRRKGVGILAVSQDSCQRLLPSRYVVGYSDEVLQAHCVERFWRTREKSS
jgi:hypothetical protein